MWIDVLVLASLARRPVHGCELRRKVEETVSRRWRRCTPERYWLGSFCALASATS
ncbi:hypothetical protein QRX50_24085 [Amycolatopsis carbonis]|uniref:Uncharacterized protein n=1 Tax=Amycolatopsis carbonis TaxID=715471 RepID=A0A9Y2IRS8_9PSEU|nr:hypothetical protein [Amycolatopsis sp. 2-15]WIX83613.1 hypothetical protein QRX50_24085 [Amycolatopsis sp. 2-15]